MNINKQDNKEMEIYLLLTTFVCKNPRDDVLVDDLSPAKEIVPEVEVIAD